MGIKKKSRVSAEFNMSSLTDIIFLLLIFFMLTSSLVTPNALNLQLPGQKSNNPSTSSGKIDAIKIEKNGTYYWNGTKISINGIENRIRALKKQKGVKAMITVSPHRYASNTKVVPVLDAAYRIGIGVTMTEPR